MPSSDPLLIYGATGYTGRMLARAAVARGLKPVLGARSGPWLRELSESLGLEHRIAALDGGLSDALGGMKAVIHAAGPFSGTFRPMVDACLQTGAHYLDVSGELAVFEALRQRDPEARERGVMVMPGAGFDVVASDCLAVHVAQRTRDARRLAIGISGLNLISRGSLRTLLAEGMSQQIHVRRGGALVPAPTTPLGRSFDFGEGPRPSVALNWPDLVTAYCSTGVPDIEVYVEANPPMEMALRARGWLGAWLQVPAARAWVERMVESFPEGPTEAERAGRRAVVVAEVEDGAGRVTRARLTTPEAYGFTCVTALALAERALADDVEPGFQTPGRVYGPDFVLRLPGVTRDDLGAG